MRISVVAESRKPCVPVRAHLLLLVTASLLRICFCVRPLQTDQPPISCSPIESQFDLPDVKLCQRLLENIAKARCSQKECCQEAERFRQARCHCWSGFTPKDLKPADKTQSRCSDSQGKQNGASSALSGASTETSASADADADAAQADAVVRILDESAATAFGAAEETIKLFVGVLTSGKNVEARAAIRSSWGHSARLHRVMFFAAKPKDPKVFESLRKEAATQRDIVMLPDVWEGYHNISHQTLEIFRAAALHPLATHSMKVDDDSYIRVDKLLTKLGQVPSEKMFMGAIEDPGGGPNREVGHQWYVSEKDWPSDVFPPWAHGVGYVVTQDLVREIAAGAAMATMDHRLFHLEDVAMGSWIKFVAKDKDWDISLFPDRRFNFGGCRSGDVVAHYVTPQAMQCMAKQRREQCCTSEGKPRGFSSRQGLHDRFA